LLDIRKAFENYDSPKLHERKSTGKGWGVGNARLVLWLKCVKKYATRQLLFCILLWCNNKKLSCGKTEHWKNFVQQKFFKGQKVQIKVLFKNIYGTCH